MKTKREHIKKHIHYKLANRIKIYFAISIIMIGVVVYEVITTWFNPFLALGLRGIGLIAWYYLSRMFKIYWHIEDKIITSRVDRIWWIILWVYMAFSFLRHYLIGLFVQAPLVFVVTFSLVAGIMIGRFFWMRDTIIKILKKQEIL